MVAVPQKIKSIGRQILNLKTLPGMGRAFVSDYIKWIRFSMSIDGPSSNKTKAILLLNLHSIEKALSFKDAKSNFGKSAAKSLLKRTDQYLNEQGADSLGLAALGVLNQYIEHPKSGKDDQMIAQFRQITEKYKIPPESFIGGVKPVTKDTISTDFTYEDLYKFASKRHSVRNFSDEEVTEEQILNAVKFAQTAPSVCNRQTGRVHVFSKDSFGPIIKAQLGDQGWVNNANKLFIITTDLNFFGGTYERNQAFIEGGLFSMQFVMGLHAQRIASCCKMYLRSPATDREVYKASKISPNETLIMLILAGHYESETVKVPYSFRFPTRDVVTFH